MPAAFLPARHWTAGGLLQQAEQVRSFDRRRGCRRDIRSTAGPDFWEALALPRAGPAEETVFLRTVRIDLKSAVSLQANLAGVKSGPDVFADALVPVPERAAPGVSFPKNDCLIDARRIAARAISYWRDGYLFAKAAR